MKMIRRMHKGMRRRFGKKAFIADALVDLYAYIMFLLVVIVFYIIFKTIQDDFQESLTASRDIFAGNLYAATYLRMPLQLNGVDMTMSDLIRLADKNDDYKDEFLKATRYFLIRMPSAETQYTSVDLLEETHEFETKSEVCYYLKVEGKDLKSFFSGEGCGFSIGIMGDLDPYIDLVEEGNIPVIRFRSIIPSFDQGENIEVYFYFNVGALASAYGKVHYDKTALHDGYEVNS